MTALSPVFVVGTGRSGSTLLSRCLRAHPEVCSLSELFVFVTDLGGRIAESFPEGDVSGEQLWGLLAGAHPRQTLMLRNDVMMDEALYRPSEGSRFTRESGVPALVATTLTHLFADPERELDALEPFVRSLAPAPAGTQYCRVFDHLRERLGARVWVERSGGSLRITARLRTHFPTARFVHIVRDGRDTALSMSKHLGFRMALVASQLTELLGVDPFESPNRAWLGDVPDELLPFLPEAFDGPAFLRYETPPPLCAHYWAGEIIAGLQELEGLGPDALLTIRYEDILSAPAETLARFFRFVLEGPPGDGIEEMAKMIHRPRSAWRELPQEVQRDLTVAARPGFEALRGVAEWPT
jgi:putative sulfotransferase